MKWRTNSTRHQLNQETTQPRIELNPGMNSTKERTQPGYELNQSGNELNQQKF